MNTQEEKPIIHTLPLIRFTLQIFARAVAVTGTTKRHLSALGGQQGIKTVLGIHTVGGGRIFYEGLFYFFMGYRNFYFYLYG
jgi:hypothetical protein